MMYPLEDLLDACRVLYGTEIDRGFLSSLDHAALKSVYRERAKATHPDRIIRLDHGGSFPDPGALFREVCEAYKRLDHYLTLRTTSRPQPSQKDRRTDRTAPRRPRAPEAAPRSNPVSVPGWPLRTGEFLYFRGVISWKALIQAIVLQRRGRLRIGEIAAHWGWLTEAEVVEMLAGRYPGEHLGHILVRNGVITPFQLRVLLHHQRKCQTPIGQYFLGLRGFDEEQLEKYLKELRRHNSQFR